MIVQSMGLSRVFFSTAVQKHQFFSAQPSFWSSSHIYAAAAAAAKSFQSCPTLCDPRDGSPPGSRPWVSPGKNTGVGCRFLLQCMKVESESEVAQSYPTPSDPMDCSLPGSSIHGIFQARVLEWGAIAFSNTHPTPSISTYSRSKVLFLNFF